jgi:hypothetical protein
VGRAEFGNYREANETKNIWADRFCLKDQGAAGRC